MMQLGPTARGMLYIQLSNFPKHYLVIVITDDEFRYALISVNVLPESTHGSMVMEDIAWLDLRRIHGFDDTVATGMEQMDVLGTEIVTKGNTFSGRYVVLPICHWVVDNGR
jgi:mediator of RNA polymerase II transcription subunit 14